MIKKIFQSTLLASLGVVLASTLLILGFLYSYFTDLQFEHLQAQTNLVARGLSLEGKAYFEGLTNASVRITWIDDQGKVLYDTQSDSTAMENHLDREEIQEALKTGFGQSSRHSDTLTQESLYVAQQLSGGEVVRLSVTQQSILKVLIGILPPIGFIIILAILVSVFLSRYTARKIVQPLDNINLEQPLSNHIYDELTPLLRRIAFHQEHLEEQKKIIQRREQEFDTITSKIKESLILLDTNRCIVNINQAASQLFHTNINCLGKDILELSRDVTLNQLIDSSLVGQKKEGIVSLGDLRYRVLVRPILSEKQVTGVALLLFDITEEFQMEEMRREFTANVSHELKTPLQVISGYSELLSQQEVPQESARRFSQKIYGEAKRLIQLVEDIINLSYLDEVKEVSKESIDLYDMSQEVLTILEERISEKELKVSLEGQSALLNANPALLHSMIYNLCDNAIKYNRQGGEILICIKNEESSVLIAIKDTGIGIAKEDMARIFERFYRVDRSRSKTVGGTGLGLSIVKHGIEFHGASITVDSQLGQGTQMTIQFPKIKK